MKEKTATQRLLSLLLACVLCLTCTPVAFAESAVAASMRLMKTEGTVSVSNSSGRAVTQTERMSLRSGYQLKTEEKSYAWINLDDVKMVEMDAVTEISIRKKDRKLDILVDSGNLLFKVDQHLEGDENLNIRTSTMGVGIRGTCGWVKVIDQWTSQIYILEGTVAVTVTDPVTGETKTENISAGEMAICTVYPQDRAGSKCEIVRQEFTVADIDGFVLVELTPNKPLCDKIYEESGLDLRDPSVKPAEKLKQDQELVRDKLEEIEKQLQEQEDKISVEPVWTNPVPDPVPATPNADSSSGGGGGGGGSTPAPTETITLTMPQTAATVNAYLGRSSVRQVILQPGAARASSANLLEVDSPLTVPNGKILTLQATVGLTLNEDQTLSVYGTMTVDGECRLYGSLVPNKNAVIKAKFFEIPDHLADWQVSETPGSDGFYSLFYSPKGTVYTVAFDANGGTVAPGELVTGTDGRLAALPTPVREGYAFNGWFTAAEGGAQVTTATVFTQNATIYAHWTEDAGIGGDNWEYDPAIKTLYISGNGPMDNFDGATNAPWDKYRPEVVAIVVREGVTSIGDFAFVECPQLVTMDIPVSVTSVGNYATSGSNNLADVYYGGTEGQWHEVGIADGNDPLLNANIHFTGSDGTACVTFNPNGGAVTPQYYFVGLDGKVGTLPTPVREGYTFDGWFTAADGGTQITTNTVFTQNTTVYAHWTGETSGVTWRYDEATKTLYIEGSGEMEDYASSAHMPWVQYVSEIRSVNIKNGVTSIGVYAFSNCTSLTSVTIPSSVTRIGKGAFLACSSLPNVSIPEGVTSLEKYVFMDCTSLASVNIPDSVTKIDEDAFCDCSSLASVTIPNNVTSIGNEAFIRCTSLTSVTIPSSVTSIGYHAFHSCTNLTSVTIPNSVTSIGYSAFEDCTSLTSVTIPASVTSIDGSTFSSCTSLTSVTIPVSVIRFGNFAFSSCTKLTDVYYNGTETQWNAITINTGNEPLLNANIHFQGEDSGVTWRYDAPTKTLYIEGNGPMDDYTISSNGSSAPWMSYKTQMQTLIIENGVTSLGDYAFHDCASLTGVEIPDSVVAIGEYAFSGCSNLYQISIPDSVTTINVGAFARAGLTNAYIPGSVTNLGNGLFNSCASLTNVDFGDGITSISQSMFMNCSSLTSIAVPVSVTSVGDAATMGCSNLTDVYYGGTQTQWDAVTVGAYNTPLLNATIHCQGGGSSEIGGEAGENVRWAYDEATKTLTISGTGVMKDYSYSYTPQDVTTAPWATYATEMQSLVIENGVTSIGDNAFSGCSGLSSSLELPASITSIGRRAFYHCSGLTGNLVIPNGVATIQMLTFAGCSGFTGINIPTSVTTIEVGAFSSCTGLTAAAIPNSVTTLGAEAFISCESLSEVSLPSRIPSILPRTFGHCNSLTNVIIPDSVEAIDQEAFWFCNGLASVTIPASVTTIGASAFSSCPKLADVYFGGTEAQWNAISIVSNAIPSTATIHFLGGGDVEEGDGYRYNTATKTLYIADDGPMADNITSDKRPWNAYRGEIQTVVIEKGVTNIGDSVFARCTSLTSVTIPDGVTRIAAAAFDNCSSLTSVEIPDGVTWIGERAFRGCSNMKSVTIPGSVGKIEREAFYGCSSLTSVTIPDSITSIGYGTFNGCSSLTSVTVPGSVSTIDMSTFAGCSGLTSVTILDGVGSLGMRAFEFCSNLTNVTIPDSVTRIENLAFNGCNNLTDVYYSGTQDQWNAINTGTNNTSLTTANIHYNSRARSVVSNAASGYTDVPAGAAYAEAVNYCKTNNLMTGTSDTTFSPDGALTRAMMVTVLHRLAGKPAAASTASFTDVAAGKWYTDAIAWANSKGIVLGYNASTFGVNDPVTHEQVALIFQRYSGNPNVQTEGADSPKTPATRAEIALTLMNYAKTYQPGTLSSVSAIDVMCAPSGIALDKNGTLLVTDVFSKQLWRVENRTGTAYAGGATVPDLYGQPLGGYNDASLGSSTFKEPWAIAPFLDGWAVSDTANNAVRLVRTSGIQTLNAATKEKLTVTNLGVAFNRPTGLAADGDGNLYVSDTGSGTVRRVSPQGGVTTVAKNLSDPMGLCWKNGALYIAETGRNRIVKLEKGTVSVVAGSGTADLTDGAAKTAAFSAPQGVTAGDDGSVYVADTGNSAIRKIKGGSVTTLVVQDPQQLSGGMISPTGLLLQGNSLYICDPFTRKIAILTVA